MKVLETIFIVVFILLNPKMDGQNKLIVEQNSNFIEEEDSIVIITDTIRRIDTIIQYIDSRKDFSYKFSITNSFLGGNTYYQNIDYRTKNTKQNISSQGYEIAFNLQVEKNNYFTGIGFGYLKAPGKIPFKSWNILKSPVPVTIIDTIAIWKHDYDNNETWVYEIDTILYNSYDSTYLDNPSVFEMPVYIGHNFEYKKNFSCDFYCGILTSLMIFPREKYLFLSPHEKPKQLKDFINEYSFSVTAGFNYNYKIFKQVELLLGLFMSKTIYSSLNSSFGKNHQFFYGLKTGIGICW